jgi:hypothetical protein
MPADLPGILDDGPLSEEDIEAVLAFLDDPVSVTDDGELARSGRCSGRRSDKRSEGSPRQIRPVIGDVMRIVSGS